MPGSGLAEIKRLRVLEFSVLSEFRKITAADRRLGLRFCGSLVAGYPEIDGAVRLRRAFKDPPANQSAFDDCFPRDKIGSAVAVIIAGHQNIRTQSPIYARKRVVERIKNQPIAVAENRRIGSLIAVIVAGHDFVGRDAPVNRGKAGR